MIGRPEPETWLPVVGYEARYEVPDLGRVRSLVWSPPRLISVFIGDHGYPRVHLSKDGKQKTHKLHRIVALAFHGHRKNILHNEVAHLDGKPANARADNLKWVSKVENHSHKRLHGTHQNGHRILSLGQVDQIRLRGGTAKELGAKYGVSVHAIYDIWCGKWWRTASIGAAR